MSLNAEYTYESILPFMFASIKDRASQSTGGKYNWDANNGMTIMQKRLWDQVWHMKDKVNCDPAHESEHAAIRQWWLEKGVWVVYCKFNFKPTERVRE